MNIALDATYSLGRNLSGVGVYCRRLLWGLADSHPDSHFTFCYRPHRFGKSIRETLPANTHRGLLAPLLTPSCDIFHGLNQRMPPGRMRRLAVTFHDLFVMTGDYSTPEFRARFTKQAREAADRADLVIAVSRFTAGQVEALLGVDAGRIRVVPHGVDAPYPAAAPFPAREPLVLHVGAIQKRKNVARLVHAFEALPAPWRLVLAGSSGFGAEETMQAVATSRARERIEICGYVDDEELQRLYGRASVFAFPSLDEGFGIPVLEAMARGIPVLTSNRSSLPEVAGNAALLVDPSRTEEIAAGLLLLAADSELREAMVQKGLERARRFTWEAAVDQTWAVYRELE